ncbi:hypothetical protein [Blastococcus saxobsidens]|uniref:Uncharacterized protein n=1 Tax=Blastococcus saxobsidens (strain DD2) TaxID=1146883 RepID=H6RN63_BLASD|nr:hypothetical protein [Blastococcus saxobsidens]CCG02611.1 protein of unknown function [Blastococcus saxobsidens DD2]
MTHVSVMVGDGHRDSLDGVVENLRASGLEVEQVLGTLGSSPARRPTTPSTSFGGARASPRSTRN